MASVTDRYELPVPVVSKGDDAPLPAKDDANEMRFQGSREIVGAKTAGARADVWLEA